MTELYLNKKRVYFDDSQSLKVTRENPLLTRSGAFTLDVKLPMDIKENIEVLGNINRIDVQRKYTTFRAVLLTSGKVVLDGTAVVTGVDDTSVKVQLLSGNSEVRFWDKAGKVFIDAMDKIGEWPFDIAGLPFANTTLTWWYNLDFSQIVVWGDGTFEAAAGRYNTLGLDGQFVFMPVYDESNDTIVNNHLHVQDKKLYVRREAVQPNLMFVLREVLWMMGYTLSLEGIDTSLVSQMYIANARKGDSITCALPHWTVKEFIENVQDFLNCTIVFDDVKKEAAAVRNSHVGNLVDISDDVLDEFTAEIISDDDVDQNIVSSNIAYSERGGESDVDMVDLEVLQAFENLEYSSLNAVQMDTANGRDTRKVYVTPEGKFVYDGEEYHKIDHFGALAKNADNLEDRYELKIVPCRTVLKEFHTLQFATKVNNFIQNSYLATATMLSMTNAYQAAENETAWEAVLGNEVDKGTEKEDIMQVFLIDDKLMQGSVAYREAWLNSTEEPEDAGAHKGDLVYYPMPFTERGLNMLQNCTDNHRDWSLALTNCRCSKFHGQCFRDGVQQDNNVEHCFSFVSKSIPDVMDVYFIRGKRYRCKKFEMSFNSETMDPVIKGYFVEVT